MVLLRIATPNEPNQKPTFDDLAASWDPKSLLLAGRTDHRLVISNLHSYSWRLPKKGDASSQKRLWRKQLHSFNHKEGVLTCLNYPMAQKYGVPKNTHLVFGDAKQKLQTPAGILFEPLARPLLLHTSEGWPPHGEMSLKANPKTG